MSELKAYKGDIYIPVYGSIADAKVYLKSEVDEVITEKNIEIVELKEENAQLMKEMKFMHSNCETALMQGGNMKRIKYLFINIGELIILPFLLIWDVTKMLWGVLTESPEEAEERERHMLHDENLFGR